MKKIPLLLSVIILIATQPSFGWGQKAHDVVAAIAEANLNKKAEKKISEILDGKSMVYYSKWMDDLRNSPEWESHYKVTETWHFANVDEGKTYDTMEPDPKGDVLVKTEMIIAELTIYKELGDSVKREYLMMLIHMVGDMHCPMHAGRRTDRGGNSVTEYWFSQKTNLHAIWDTNMIESARTWSYTEWQENLDRTTKKEKEQIWAGTPRQWFDETVTAAAQIYATTPPNSNLSYQYMYNHNALLERQLLYAGYRLAHVLNTIFG